MEKYFPDRNVRVFVGSWNMNGQVPPPFLADFLLPLNIEYVPDILVIGTQVCIQLLSIQYNTVQNKTSGA